MNLGLRPSFAGRNVGSDFSGKDGWSMYHGSTFQDSHLIHIEDSRPLQLVAKDTSIILIHWEQKLVLAKAMYSG